MSIILGFELFLFWELFLICTITCAGLETGKTGCGRTEVPLIVKAKPSLPPVHQSLVDELNYEIKMNIANLTSPSKTSSSPGKLEASEKRKNEMYRLMMAPTVICESSECLQQADITCEERKTRCSGDHEWLSHYTFHVSHPFLCCKSPSVLRSKIIRTVPVQLGEHAFLRGFEQDSFQFGEAIIGLDVKSDGTTVVNVARFKCIPKEYLLPSDPPINQQSAEKAAPPLPPKFHSLTSQLMAASSESFATEDEEERAPGSRGRGQDRSRSRSRSSSRRRSRGRSREKRNARSVVAEKIISDLVNGLQSHPRNLKKVSFSSELRRLEDNFVRDDAMAHTTKHHHSHHQSQKRQHNKESRHSHRGLSRQRRSGGFKDMLDKPGCNSEWDSTAVVGASAHRRGANTRILRSTPSIQESPYCGVDVREAGWGFSKSDRKY